MFFEGSEKKFEVWVDSSIDLRKLGREYWQKVIEKCNATIISEVSTNKIDAYLLSESSLFVWSDRFLMITCGRTILVNSMIEFIKDYGKQSIKSLIFQRKNEYLPRQQHTFFDDDVELIKQYVPGHAYRFGRLDSHHNYIFHADLPFNPPAEDTTSELLMYHIQGEAADLLRSPKQTKEMVRNLLGLDKVIPTFKLDDFVFEPCGYSLNAVDGDKYLTMHITPQEDSSYVSFETNIDINKNNAILPHIVSVLKPQSFDTIYYEVKNRPNFSKDYMTVHKVEDVLGCGYQVSFCHYMNKFEGVDRAVRL